MFNNISSVGRATINPYNQMSKTRKVQSANPFFQEDSFTISDDAMILSAALNEVKASLNAEMGKLDTDKINSLKQQIAAGVYNVSGSDVVAKLFANN